MMNLNLKSVLTTTAAFGVSCAISYGIIRVGQMLAERLYDAIYGDHEEETPVILLDTWTDSAVEEVLGLPRKEWIRQKNACQRAQERLRDDQGWSLKQQVEFFQSPDLVMNEGVNPIFAAAYATAMVKRGTYWGLSYIPTAKQVNDEILPEIRRRRSELHVAAR